MLVFETSGNGRPLVALHGNMASRAWWQNLLHTPPAGYQVFAPDLPGFGDSPWDGGPGSIAHFADAVGAFLVERNLVRPVLLGHSLGGAVALELAARAPERYRALVLADSAPLEGLRTSETAYPVLAQMQHDSALRGASLEAQFPSRRPDNLEQILHDAGRMHVGHYQGNARALADWSVQAQALHNLPTLVLGGEQDSLITPDMLRLQARALGTSARIFPGRGHGFPQEDPQAFLDSLQTFLDALSVSD